MTAPRERIVVGIDGSDGARHALSWALVEAAARRADLEVLAAFPVDFYWMDPYLADHGQVEAVRSDTEARARALVDEVQRNPAVAGVPGVSEIAVRVVVAAGAAAAHLVDRSADAALLVVGNRGRGGIRSSVAGSVALHCAAHARCPVVVVHSDAQPPEEPARVVVGLDDSDQGRDALVTGVEEARRVGARVDVVVACEPLNYWSDVYAVMAPPIAETLDYARKRAQSVVAEVLGGGAVDGDAVQVRAVEGYPGRVLAEEARGARLLVVGSRSHNQLEGLLLGSVALHCVMHAACPVLVVRPETTDRRAAHARAFASTALTAG